MMGLGAANFFACSDDDRPIPFHVYCALMDENSLSMVTPCSALLSCDSDDGVVPPLS
jgi:hypothetical protein